MISSLNHVATIATVAGSILLLRISVGDFSPTESLKCPRRLRGVGHLRHGYNKTNSEGTPPLFT